jgi:hypothetical protein
MTHRRRLALASRISLLTAGVLVLSACGRPGSDSTPVTADSAAPPPAATTSPADTPPSDAATAADSSATPQKECQGEPVQYAVGSPYTPELAEKIRELSGSTVVRVLHPGDIVTMEFRLDRVSVTVDDKNVVTQVTCG